MWCVWCANFDVIHLLGNKGGRQLTELMKAAPALHSQFSSGKLLGKNYHRVNPPFVDQVFALDDPSVLQDMVVMALEYDLDKAVAWIKQHFYGGEDPKKKQEREKGKEGTEKEPSSPPPQVERKDMARSMPSPKNRTWKGATVPTRLSGSLPKQGEGGLGSP